MKFSICIPTYEMHGKGEVYLKDLFNSLYKQTYKNFEVIVSDHSKNDIIKNFCVEWSKKFNLIYLCNNKKRGNSSANMNNTIKRAVGDVIKIMHQDDFFYSDQGLEKIKIALDEASPFSWGACAFVHTDERGENFYKIKIPYYNKNIIRAINTIGAPSVIFFHNNKSDLFDENLIWMNECELYYRLFAKYGEPLIINDTIITIRLWANQVTNTLATKRLRKKEIKYSLKKHQQNNLIAGLFIKMKNKLKYRFSSTILLIIQRVTNYILAKKNKENLLTYLANKHRSDKGTRKLIKKDGDRHYYTEIYHSYFEKIRLGKINLLEIGIGGGSSLKIWQKYFPNAKIYAIDIDDFSRLNNNRITCLQANQSSREQLEKVMNKINEKMDIIIDDGGHYMGQQQISFGFLFKHLKSDGLYFIEDLHTSYWPYKNFTSIYNNIPIDTNEDKSNTTLKMIKDYIKNGKIISQYLLGDELKYLNENIKKCILHDTVINKYGPNHLGIFIKK